MPNIELDNALDRRNLSNGIKAQPMTRMTFKTERFGMTRSRDDTSELQRQPRRIVNVLGGDAIRARMQFHRRRTELFCLVDLPNLRIDKKSDPDATLAQTADDGPQLTRTCDNI